MPIDSSIYSQAQQSSPLNALASGYKLGNQIRQQPMLDKLNQQKLDAGQVEIDNAKLKQQEALHGLAKSSLQSDYYGAMQIAPYVAAGDMQKVTDIINQRKALKQQLGAPTDSEDNFLAALQSNPEQAKQGLASVISVGEKIFGKENATAWQRQFQDMTNGFSEQDKVKAQRIAAGLDPRAVTVGNKIETVGGVPYIINPMTGGATVPSVLNQPVSGTNAQGQLPSPVPSAIDANAVANNAATIEREKVAAAEKAKNDAAIAAQNTKNAANETDVNRLLDQAEPLIDTATSSELGRARDAGLSVFGVSTDAGDAAAQLKTLEANLVMKMPRMEGPQSNMDQQLYKQMAAQVGDASVPASQRKAAINMLRSISSKYTGGNQAQQQSSQQSQQAPRPAIDFLKSNPSPEVKAQFKQKYGYLPEGM